MVPWELQLFVAVMAESRVGWQIGRIPWGRGEVDARWGGGAEGGLADGEEGVVRGDSGWCCWRMERGWVKVP